MRIIRPGRNVRGVISHAEGKEEEGREEGQEDDDKEEEEITSVDQVNAVVFGPAGLLTGPSAKARPRHGCIDIRRGPARKGTLETALRRGFFSARMHPYTDQCATGVNPVLKSGLIALTLA